MNHLPVWLAVVVLWLAEWRWVRLIVIDYLTEPIRDRAGKVTRSEDDPSVITSIGREKMEYLFNCPWCMSVWWSPVFVVPPILWPSNRLILGIALALAGSAMTGLLATIESRLDR